MRYHATAQGNVPFTEAENKEFDQMAALRANGQIRQRKSKLELLIDALIVKGAITPEDINEQR